MIVILDGPEKAGKTTTAHRLTGLLRKTGYKVAYTHWGPVANDRVYGAQLRQDVLLGKNAVAIWDRSWASESVYSRLLKRDPAIHRLGYNWGLGHYLYGRAVDPVGVRAMLLGPSAKALERLRDATDLKVNPRDEREYFEQYAKMFGWVMYKSNHTATDLDACCQSIIERLGDVRQNMLTPPIYCGNLPKHTSVVMVGESRSEGHRTPDVWLPFSSPFTREFAMGVDTGLQYGYTNIDGVTKQTSALYNGTLMVACGHKAYHHVREVLPGNQVITVPHPSYLLRWGKTKGGAKIVIDELKQQIGSYLEKEITNGKGKGSSKETR